MSSNDSQLGANGRSARDERLAARVAAVVPTTPDDAARVVEGLAFGNLQLEDSRLERATVTAAVRRLVTR